MERILVAALLVAAVAPPLNARQQQAPGNSGVAAGGQVGIGGGYQLANRLWAVMDLHYHRLFTDGSSPNWLLPGSIGLELR